ncbi:MAG: phosphatidylglycerol lysyltransferase domain-containing protein [Deltaproteobacteria bacterium]|nr:phosphatidylglycerol lysyltransferase domain-containing protein [Deltaproteobacteria bacterium]
MSFKPLILDDRPTFVEMEKRYPLYTSDANFTNMFIWQGFYNFSWTTAHDCLCLISHPSGGTPFAMPPLGPPENKLKAVEFLIENMDEPRLSRIPGELTEAVRAAHPTWRIESNADNDDYVYLAEKVINLSGRRMHQKKNHYNGFVKSYRHELVTITPDLHDELVEVEAKWLISKTEKIGEESHLQIEKQAVHLLLEHFSTLAIQGLAIRVEGQIEAFSLGESLSPDTALIHVEKGSPTIRGIYVALCSSFCRVAFSDKTYINREQDLGLPGLRWSKESLKPDHMRKKFDIWPL